MLRIYLLTLCFLFNFLISLRFILIGTGFLKSKLYDSPKKRRIAKRKGIISIVVLAILAASILAIMFLNQRL